MVLPVAMIVIASMLFFFGAVQSHWIAPGALFAVSAPVVMVLSFHLDVAEIAGYLAALLASFYAAFAIGRWTAPKIWPRLVH